MIKNKKSGIQRTENRNFPNFVSSAVGNPNEISRVN